MASENDDQEPARPRAYDRVEGLHLRQWVLRPVPVLAALCTNGHGLVDVPWLPRQDGGTPSWLEVGAIALITASAVLRVLAKGVLVRKTILTTGGAYARCRHPFYLANLVGAVGTLLLAGVAGAWAALAWLVVAIPVYRVTIAGEESGLGRLYPSAWEAYAARVPALFPLPARGGDRGATRVTWRNLVREREPPRLLRFLGGALLVAGVAATGREPLLFAAVACYAASYVLPSLTGSGKERSA